MGKDKARILALAAGLSVLGAITTPTALAWTVNGTSGADAWLIGATASTGGTLEVCDLNSHSIITWPSGTAPGDPLSSNGVVNMNAGNDYVRIINNDGTYDSGCGFMYAVHYSSFALTIKGGDGDDQLIGGAGTDHIFGDATSDPDTCQAATTGAADYLASGGGVDDIWGCGGDDTFDTLYTPASGTVVYGGDGADCLEGLSGVTVYSYDSPCDTSGTNEDGDVDMLESTNAKMDDNTCLSPELNGKNNYSPADGDTRTAGLVCA